MWVREAWEWSVASDTKCPPDLTDRTPSLLLVRSAERQNSVNSPVETVGKVRFLNFGIKWSFKILYNTTTCQKKKIAENQ
jgi:hypothetical protein